MSDEKGSRKLGPGGRRRRLGIVLLAAMVAAACGGSASSSGSPSEPEPAATSVPGQSASIEDLIAQDGSVSFEAAVGAIAATFGPLDGFGSPDPRIERPADGSAALRWITRHADRLDERQRASLDALFAEGTTSRRSGPLVAALGGGGVSLVSTDELDILIKLHVQAIQLMTRDEMDAPIKTFVSGEMDRPIGAVRPIGTGASTADPASASGPLQRCEIRMFGPSENLSNRELSGFVGQLVWQCYLWDSMDIEDAAKVPPWIWEGSAAWFGDQLGAGSSITAPFWTEWLADGATRSLFARAGSALGFFAHADQSGVGLETPVVMKDMALVAIDGTSEAAYALMIGRSGAIEDDWGPSYHRVAALGPAWQIEGPGIPGSSAGPAPKSVAVTDGEIETLEALPLTGVPYLADLQAEVIWLDGSGVAGRIALDLGSLVRIDQTIAELGDVALCTIPGGCSCAANSVTGEATKFLPISTGPQRIGIAGGLGGATLHLVGQTLEDFCGVCVLGQWELDNDTVTPLELLVPAPAGTGAQTPLGSYGSVQMFFREDGYWQVFVNGFTSHYNGAGPAGHIPFIRIKTTGKATGSYAVERAPDGEDRWTVTLTIAGSTLQTIHTTFLGREPDGITRREVASSTPPLSPVVAALNGPVAMTCGQDTLTVEVPTAGGPIPVRFHRPRGA